VAAWRPVGPGAEGARYSRSRGVWHLVAVARCPVARCLTPRWETPRWGHVDGPLPRCRAPRTTLRGTVYEVSGTSLEAPRWSLRGVWHLVGSTGASNDPSCHGLRSVWHLVGGTSLEHLVGSTSLEPGTPHEVSGTSKAAPRRPPHEVSDTSFRPRTTPRWTELSPPVGAQRDSSTTGFRSTPIPETSTSNTSPAFSHTGGCRFDPTPPGVPVAMTSPGTSSVNVVM
jgi:hypothetical protein